VGQDYAGQRYYNLSIGRFWSLDPGGIRTAHLGNPTTWNRYAHLNGDPINFGDPTGLDCCGDGDPSTSGDNAPSGCAVDDDGSIVCGESPTGGSGTPQDPYTGFSATSTASPDPDPTPDP
jgi:RHS repeat-associated protein